MAKVHNFVYPDIPENLMDILFQDDKQMIIVGVLGKSRLPDCNKMAGFEVLNVFPSLADPHTSGSNLKSEDKPTVDTVPPDGQISFYFERNGNVMYMHFVTPFDCAVAQRMAEELATEPSKSIHTLNGHARQRFAQSLLMAIQMCHIVVLIETGNVFDAAYLSMFKALKIVRDKYIVPTLPKLLKSTSAGAFMGKDLRLCSPRFLFYFEKCLHDLSDQESLNKLEFDTEDKIYKMLRNEFIITNNSAQSLFSIPRNKRFVYINSNAELQTDPLTDSIEMLIQFIESSSNNRTSSGGGDSLSNDMDDIRPFKGFAKPLKLYAADAKDATSKSNRRFSDLLQQHANEAMANGFDDSIAKFKGKSQFVVPNVRSWFATFDLIHAIFTGNLDPNIVGTDTAKVEEYRLFHKQFLGQFHKILDVDERFFSECCEYGLELAIDHYLDMLPGSYSYEFHAAKMYKAFEVLAKYARDPAVAEPFRVRLKQSCESIWLDGRQQCGFQSLRGNPCVQAKHEAKETIDQHSSGVVYVSSCNCGRIQGRREDPYTIREANYDFYQMLAGNCSTCNKLERFQFAVFEPSICDYRAADVEHKLDTGKKDEDSMDALMKMMRNTAFQSDSSPVPGKDPESSLLVNETAASQQSQPSLSLNSIDNEHEDDTEQPDLPPDDPEDIDDNLSESDSESFVDEIVITVKGAGHTTDDHTDRNAAIMRQPSTTEYLPGMVHTESPAGLVPQFPSWSLLCIGPSSVYSHNTGLPEHIQSGFMQGSNFLLPWDVHVHLEHAATWAASYEKTRSRKKNNGHQQHQGASGAADADGQVFTLKIFIGCEYECPRGHRFIMNAPDKVLRGGSGIVRDSGSKVVYNDMPLYFPCPCRNNESKVAQLMRVHIVTPKAPVNVLIEPKVRVGGKLGPVFVTGLAEPPKLTQSAYWLLRLPYVYQGDDGPLPPPSAVTADTATQHGCLMAAMYGISETGTNSSQKC